MSKDKIFCGSATKINGKYGDFLKLSLNKDDLKRITDFMEGDWVNILCKKIKDPKEGKPEYYLEVDTWKPEKQKSESDDLPF